MLERFFVCAIFKAELCQDALSESCRGQIQTKKAESKPVKTALKINLNAVCSYLPQLI
ncbi:MAG: hypothetical protein ABR595_03525 [Psychroflexus sp.]